MLNKKALSAASAPAGGWDITTAAFNGSPLNFLSVAAQTTTPQGLFIDSTGTRVYIATTTTARSIYQYSLSTAWNLSTGSYVRSFSVQANADFPGGVTFSSDGTKMYVTGSANSGSVVQYFAIK